MVQDLDGLFHRFLGMNLLLRNYFFWSFMCKKSHILVFFFIFFHFFFVVCEFASIFASHLIGNKQNEKNHFRRCRLRYVRIRCLF